MWRYGLDLIRLDRYTTDLLTKFERWDQIQANMNGQHNDINMNSNYNFLIKIKPFELNNSDKIIINRGASRLLVSSPLSCLK